MLNVCLYLHIFFEDKHIIVKHIEDKCDCSVMCFIYLIGGSFIMKFFNRMWTRTFRRYPIYCYFHQIIAARSEWI